MSFTAWIILPSTSCEKSHPWIRIQNRSDELLYIDSAHILAKDTILFRQMSDMRLYPGEEKSFVFQIRMQDVKKFTDQIEKGVIYYTAEASKERKTLFVPARKITAWDPKVGIK